jgi:sterol desaturase/sphingolipid hydroxylase (fatty acid hydroxylase superfamily)
MNLQNGYTIETIALLVLIILFVVAEKFFGARKIPANYKLLPDVVTLIIVLVFVQFSRLVLPLLFAFLGNLPAGLQSFLVDLPFLFKLVTTLVFVDFGFYVLHYGLHRWSLLWRSHIWHHSPETLTWLTGFRSSLMHVLFYGVPQVIAINYFFQFDSFELGFLLVWGLFFQLWTHSNIELPSRRMTSTIEWLFTTPRYHRIHHSASNNMSNNLGFMLTIWDRLFGTYQDPEFVEHNFPLGLKEGFRTRINHVIGV